ncbi:hypothetical protein EDD36DRAFT_423174 [Exophiala viscosa]|uniref:Uncharacterized protein n=1 Tax=Exophiala viscosa TaxID=2486360 RepID=A0AAN6I9I4_9EURO|nr:hypothetical protein EDD36DRAFT_423174 [Exophiala viscosa]
MYQVLRRVDAQPPPLQSLIELPTRQQSSLSCPSFSSKRAGMLAPSMKVVETVSQLIVILINAGETLLMASLSVRPASTPPCAASPFETLGELGEPANTPQMPENTAQEDDSLTTSSTNSASELSRSVTSTTAASVDTACTLPESGATALSSTRIAPDCYGETFKSWKGLSAEAKNQCIGAECCRYDYVGMKAWPAAGILDSAWNTIIFKTVLDILNDEENQRKFTGSRRRRQPILLSPMLFMLSKFGARADAIPSVVLLVAEKRKSAAKKATGFLRQHKSLRGKINLSSSRLTTLGGVLNMGPKAHYAMTCAHVFHDFGNDQDDSDEDTSSSDGEIDDAEGSVASSEKLSHQSGDEAPTMHSVFSPAQDVPLGANGLAEWWVNDPISTGRHIANAFARQPGSVFPQNLLYNTKLDWALLEITDPRLWTDNRFQTAGSQIQPRLEISTRPPPSGELIILSKLLGQLKVRSLGTKSAMNLPWAQGFVEVWAVECTSGPGLCGAWVIEPDTNILVGIVVAHSKTSPLTWLLPASAIFAEIQHRWETYGFSIHGMPHVSQFPQRTLRRAPDPDSNEQPLRHKAHEMTPSRIDALRARQRALRERLEQLTPSVLASLSKGWPTGSSLSRRPSLGHGHKQTFPSLNTANMPSASQGKDQDERLSTASTLAHTTKPQEIRAKDQDDSLSTASTLAPTTKPQEIRAKDQDHSLSTASTLASTTKCWDIRGKEQDERLSTTSTLGPIIHYSGEYSLSAISKIKPSGRTKGGK